ncbi:MULTISPECIES: hypothetical protein [Streptomyces]|uniref:hypothetical protein n=1 Tax=Streptomyces TaxID=1883 RepID=UPI000FDB00EE|nr:MULTISPECIES: hypothetical protein [unclassified Streptomyces]MCW1097830.1 hypothetical protein [Streptomyces sp. RS2]
MARICWSTTRQLIDYVREVSPRQTVGIHDGAALNEVGAAMVAGQLGSTRPGVGCPYVRLAPGASTGIG